MRRNNRGQVLVVFAIALFALMGLAALGIDVGFMYSARHELQRSADAAALAGASAFLDGDWASASIRAEATARAQSYASKDAVATKTLDPGTEVSVGFPSQDRVQVTTRRTVNTFFARVFGRATQNITAVATAEAASVDQRIPCLKPWGIPYPWDDQNHDTLYTPGETVYNICPAGTFGDPNADPPIPPDNSGCWGTRVILKIGTPAGKKGQLDIPSLQQESGHFFALDFGSGGRTYRDLIKANCGHEMLVSVGDDIPLETGNMVGPTYQAVRQDVDSLINRDSGSQWDDLHNRPVSDDYPFSEGRWMDSPRVVRIPMYDPRVVLQTGKTDMPVATFAAFWIESCEKHGRPGEEQGTVIGRFLPARAFGSTNGPAPGPGSWSSLKTLRLVQ